MVASKPSLPSHEALTRVNEARSELRHARHTSSRKPKVRYYRYILTEHDTFSQNTHPFQTRQTAIVLYLATNLQCGTIDTF